MRSASSPASHITLYVAPMSSLPLTTTTTNIAITTFYSSIFKYSVITITITATVTAINTFDIGTFLP
ncbi:hypothetical protein E2C01_101071 [Portunus trituberculatus]|uniref:Uncharacterized protein n=1 Tax=Portunus trituberculatus TaxID=210409 RepID=A0A5B7K4R3_PORTR|nr:hypothetical protein [Portunus trituberculatus]